MKPKDKYTFFDRKEKGYRKGVHSKSIYIYFVSSFFSLRMPFSLFYGGGVEWKGGNVDFVLVESKAWRLHSPFFLNYVDQSIAAEA